MSESIGASFADSGESEALTVAIIDGERDEIVIRILYDGPALAGKTTNIRALEKMLAARRRSECFTPAEAEGRTLYFDWMDYLGGWYDGHQVRCQIVSAPGQRSLAKRRALLLRDADVVIFVAESTAVGVEAAAESFVDLKKSLHRAEGPAVPVVMQANKQDLPDAIELETFKQEFLDESHVATIGASAATGIGVREAFTLSVRLALDRVRELSKQGRLRLGEPEIRSGDDLLKWLEREEGLGESHVSPPRASLATPTHSTIESSNGEIGAVREGHVPVEQPIAPVQDYAIGPVQQPVKSSETFAGLDNQSPPRLPASNAPSGLVWRPMQGRIILHDLESSKADVRCARDGSWIAIVGGRWYLSSSSAHSYSDLESGRRDLLEAARVHSSLGPLLSESRALALAETGHGDWRLWKIVRKEVSLHDRLRIILSRLDADGAEELFGVAEELVDAAELFANAGGQLRATLRGVGRRDGRNCFIGVLPDGPGSGADTSPTADPIHPDAIVRKAFGPWLEKASLEQLIDAPAALGRLRVIQGDRPERSSVIEALAAMLIGH